MPDRRMSISFNYERFKSFNTECTERGTEGHGDSAYRRIGFSLWISVLSVASVLKPLPFADGRRVRVDLQPVLPIRFDLHGLSA